MIDLIEEERGRIIAQGYNDAASISRLSDDLRQAEVLLVLDLLEASWPYKPSYTRKVGKVTATALFTPTARALQAEVPEAGQRDEGERRMRVRINTESIRRRLAEVRGRKTLSQGIMIVPAMASSMEEWEAVAIEQQERLLRAVRDDSHDAVVVEPREAMTAKQEQAFNQHMDMTRRQGKAMTEEQRAAQAYAKAIGILR